jgi:hypothetical protein
MTALLQPMNRIGRVQRRVRRALVAGGGQPVPFSALISWSYLSRRAAHWQRWSIYRAPRRWGVNVGRGLWAPNAELMRRIKGERCG